MDASAHSGAKVTPGGKNLKIKSPLKMRTTGLKSPLFVVIISILDSDYKDITMTVKKPLVRKPITKKKYRPNPGSTPLAIARYIGWVMNSMLDGSIPIDKGKALIYAQKVRLTAYQLDYQQNVFIPFRMEMEAMKNDQTQDEYSQYADVEVY
jgi:hypothetical protein